MNIYPMVKSWLKVQRWHLRRLRKRWQCGATVLEKSPRVLGNAMPKSGSHLIIQVLQGLIQVGPFVNPGFPPVNRTEDNRKLPEDAVLANLQRMRPGDIAYGYLHARQPFVSLLTQPGWATFFVYRDPRDMLVSHVLYATQMHPGHGMHKYYTQNLASMEARLNAAIEGVDQEDAELSSIRAKYEAYMGWLKYPEVLSLRFEDLILNRRQALERILDYLEARGSVLQLSHDEAVSLLEKSIQPKRSGTFRRAQPGNWKEYFTETNKAFFKERAGDILIHLGYEKDMDW